MSTTEKSLNQGSLFQDRLRLKTLFLLRGIPVPVSDDRNVFLLGPKVLLLKRLLNTHLRNEKTLMFTFQYL